MKSRKINGKKMLHRKKAKVSFRRPTPMVWRFPRLESENSFSFINRSDTIFSDAILNQCQLFSVGKSINNFTISMFYFTISYRSGKQTCSLSLG